MQTRKRAKPVKFGIKKEEKPVVTKEAEAVIEQPEEKERKVVTHQKVIRVNESEEQQNTGKPIIISQNVQITEDTDKEEKTEEVIPVQTVEETPEEIPPQEELQSEPAQRGEQEPIEKQKEMFEEDGGQVIDEEEEKVEKKGESPAFVTKESSFGKGFIDTKEDEEISEEEVRPGFRSFGNDDYEEEKKSNPFLLFFITVVVVTFLLGLVFIGGVTFLAGDKPFGGISLPSFLPSSEPTPTLEEEVEPTPTPEEEVDLSAYSIEVRNGSGITGEAAKLKKSLTDAGFTVSSVGNAKSSDYTQTQITFKSDVKQPFIKELQKELEKSYSVGSATEDATQTTDVIVIIGQETKD